MFYADETPFSGRNRRFIARDIVYVVGKWLGDRADWRVRGMDVLGGEASAVEVEQLIGVLVGEGWLGDEGLIEEGRVLRERIARILR